MRAAFIEGFGGIEQVERVGERPAPVAAGDQVVIEVQAAAVNPRDWLLVEGRYVFAWLAGRLPIVLGSDVAGTVVGLGPRARGFALGDAVLAMQTPRGGFGGFADQVAVRCSAVAHLPDGVPFDQAAGLGVAALTALQALRDDGCLRSGEHAVVLGASGGVGSFAVQLARRLGARVTGICSGANEALARRLGCDEVIDYTRGDFRAELQAVDVFFDTIGRERLATVRPCLRPGGRYVSTVPTRANTLDQLRGGVLGVLRRKGVRSRTVICRARGADLAELAGAVAAGELEVVIDSTFPLERVAEALLRSRTRRARGKIVVRVAGG